MHITVILQVVLTMGSMLMIGALLTYKVRFNEDTRSLFTALIIYVAVPSLLIASFLQTDHKQEVYSQLFWMFFISIGIYICALSFVKWLCRFLKIENQRASELAVLTVHGNTGMIGLPLCASLFGVKGVILAAAFDAGIGVSLWTVSVMVLQNRFSFSLQTFKPLLNFPLMALLLGVSLSMMAVKIPDNALHIFQQLGALTTPLALIYIGFFIPSLIKNRHKTHIPYLIVAVGVKLILLPLLVAVILSFINLENQMMAQVILLMSTMPTGAMIPIVFAQYKADESFGAAATIYATIFSLLTIPMMFYVGSQIMNF